MALKSIARVGDMVRGHLDVQGNEIIGVVQTGSGSVNNGSIGITATDDIIYIPPHAHQLTPGPSDIRDHSWRIVGTSKHKCSGKNIARDGDGGNDLDWDGYQTKPSESYIESTNTDLLSA